MANIRGGYLANPVGKRRVSTVEDARDELELDSPAGRAGFLRARGARADAIAPHTRRVDRGARRPGTAPPVFIGGGVAERKAVSLPQTLGTEVVQLVAACTDGLRCATAAGTPKARMATIPTAAACQGTSATPVIDAIPAVR